MEDRLRSRERGRNVKGYVPFSRVLTLTFVFALAAFVTLEGGSAHARTTKGLSAIDVQTAIEVGNRSYLAALEHHDAAAFAALFTDDALSLPANGPSIHGRPAIEKSMAAAFTRVAFLDGSMHTSEVHIYGESAVEIGRYSYSVTTDGKQATLGGRYLTVWRLVDGDWKIAIDSSQPDAPSGDASGAS